MTQAAERSRSVIGIRDANRPGELVAPHQKSIIQIHFISPSEGSSLSITECLFHYADELGGSVGS